MVAVILNADDFGLTDGVCRGIHELLDAGAVSSTTLMVAAHGARERFRRFSVQSLGGRAGIHLQLTGGSPLSPVSDVPSLWDETTGMFRDPRKGNVPNPDEVRLEWQRQVEEGAAALGVAPTHLDTHHGMHRRDDLFEVYVEIARAWGIPFRGAVGDLGRAIRSRGLPGTVALVRAWSGAELGAAELVQHFEDVVAGAADENVVEIICHPGHVDDHLLAISSLAHARQVDYDGILALRRRGWPENAGHFRSSFAEVWPPGRAWA